MGKNDTPTPSLFCLLCKVTNKADLRSYGSSFCKNRLIRCLAWSCRQLDLPHAEEKQRASHPMGSYALIVKSERGQIAEILSHQDIRFLRLRNSSVNPLPFFSPSGESVVSLTGPCRSSCDAEASSSVS